MKEEITIVKVKCDFCKKQLPEIEVKQELKIIVKGSSIDGGCAVGPAYKSGEYDSCYSCYSKIIGMIK